MASKKKASALAKPSKRPRNFHLFISHVTGDGYFLKISGNIDHVDLMKIKSLLEKNQEKLDKDVGGSSLDPITEGLICAARHEDGYYNRVKIINLIDNDSGFIAVHFIDIGNKDVIPLSTLCSLSKYEPMLMQLNGQAKDYYLSRLKKKTGKWEQATLRTMRGLLCDHVCPMTVDLETRGPFVSLVLNGSDLTTHLLSYEYFAHVSLDQQVYLQINKPPPVPANKTKGYTYKSLDVGSQHKVLVSNAEDGPAMFVVQLVSKAQKLQEMMYSLNNRLHTSMSEPPEIDSACLGRMSEKRIIARATVMEVDGTHCHLFFVDYGSTQKLQYSDIFKIPEEYRKPKVFGFRMNLAGAEALEKGKRLNKAFKQIVQGRNFTLKVITSAGPMLQSGELHIQKKNILDYLISQFEDKLQFKNLGMMPIGAEQSVMVICIKSCKEFYVHFNNRCDDFNVMMISVQRHCRESSPAGILPLGSSCCARFPMDGSWYRARVKDIMEDKVLVTYVDYGNELMIDMSNLRTIPKDLMKLPAMAIKCALKGFESKPFDVSHTKKFEGLTLDHSFTCRVTGIQDDSTLVVTLVDHTKVPRVDVAAEMDKGAPCSPPAEAATGTMRNLTLNEQRSNPSTSWALQDTPAPTVATGAIRKHSRNVTYSSDSSF